MKRRKPENIQVEAQENGLPISWESVKLVDVVRLNPPKKNLSKFTDSTKVTFVPMAAVDGDLGTISRPQERKLGEVKKGYTSFRNSDVLFAKITPCMENGKAAIAHNLKNGLGFGSTEFHVLRPYGDVSSEYLFHFVRQEIFRNEARRSMTGTAGQLRVPQSFMADVSLPLPPLEEQKRIIEKLTQLLERIEKANASIAKVPETLKQFRQAVLAAACSGKLVEQDPNDEPASLLRERIRAERKRKWLGELIAKGKDPKESIYEEPVEPDTSELPELTGGWVWTTMDDACLKIQDGTHFSPKIQYKERGKNRYFYVTSKNIKDNGVDLTDVTYIGAKEHKEIYKRCRPEKGDVLLIKDGAITGRATINNLDEEFSLLSSVALLKTNRELLLAGYLRYYLMSPLGFKSTTGQMTGSAITRIVLHKIKSSPISIPPLAEQFRIVAKIEELFKFAETIEVSVTKAQANAERIKQALLAKAFRGELVEQDPDDEPASVLLRRIKEDRSASVKAKS